MSYTRARIIIYVLVSCAALLSFFSQELTEAYMKFTLQGQKFVVTMTTTPTRIHQIKPTLESIFQQNISPDKIFLAIPHKFKRDGSTYNIPNWLEQDPRITIIRTQDYGPATKILGVLKEVKLDPEAIIITLDDDIIYPKNTLLHLAYKSANSKNKAFGISGVKMQYDTQGRVSQTVKDGQVSVYDSDNSVAVLRGFAGIAYKRDFFDDSVYEITSAPIACFNADDIFLSYHLAKNNISRKVISNKYLDMHKIDDKAEVGNGLDALHNLSNPALKHRECITYLRQKYPYVVF